MCTWACVSPLGNVELEGFLLESLRRELQVRYKDLPKKAGEGRGRDGAAVGAREAGAGLKLPDLCLALVPGTVRL